MVESVFTPFADFDQEELCVLLLNTRNRITHDVFLYRGTLNAVHVRPAEVFKEAIRANAASIILAYNHPSGNPTPSPADVSLTREIVVLGKTLDIPLLDPIIISDQSWLSLREKKLGFPEWPHKKNNPHGLEVFDMVVKTMESRAARENWRDTLDLATTRQADVVITRYGKPVTAMIRYADYAQLRAELQRLRAARKESYQTLLASESVLAAEWDSAEEDEAWRDL